jgi:folylpolyglutamate synthase
MFTRYFFEVFDTWAKHEDTSVELEGEDGDNQNATNVVEQPVVTAIASLGLDHVSQLGPPIEKIAGQKAGILGD